MPRRLASLYFAVSLVLAAMSGVLFREVRGLPWEVRLRGVWSALGLGSAVGIFCYGAALILAYALYFMIVRAFRESRTHLRFAVAVSVALHFILASTTPSRSVDVFSYLAHGYNTSHGFRLADVIPTYAVNETSYGDALSTIYRTPPDLLGPSPYGPLWTYFEYFAVRITGLHVFLGVLVLKFGAVAASLGSAALIWNILALTSPSLQAAGVVAYLYNPFILGELIADGHNDVWIIFFTLAALLFAVRRRMAGASILLWLAVLTKYVPLLLFPAFLRYAWVNARDRLKGFVAGAAAGAVVGAVLFAPLWAGSDGFAGARQNLGGISAFGRLALSAAPFPFAVGKFLPALLIGYLAFFLRETWAAADAPALFESAACVLLSYFVFFPLQVWCWYAALPVTLLLLSPRRNARLFAYALSIAASINSPLWSIMGPRYYAGMVRVQDWTCPGAMIALLLAYLFSSRA